MRLSSQRKKQQVLRLRFTSFRFAQDDIVILFRFAQDDIVILFRFARDDVVVFSRFARGDDVSLSGFASGDAVVFFRNSFSDGQAEDVGEALWVACVRITQLSTWPWAINGRLFCFLIAHHMDAHQHRSGKIGSRLRRELEASPDFEDLMLLEECDMGGREPGANVGTVDEALDYLRELERENG